MNTYPEHHQAFTEASWGDLDDRRADLALFFISSFVHSVTLDIVLDIEELNDQIQHEARPLFEYIEKVIADLAKDPDKAERFAQLTIEYTSMVLAFGYMYYRECYDTNLLIPFVNKLNRGQKSEIRSIAREYISYMYGDDPDFIAMVVEGISDFFHDCNKQKK